MSEIPQDIPVKEQLEAAKSLEEVTAITITLREEGDVGKVALHALEIAGKLISLGENEKADYYLEIKDKVDLTMRQEHVAGRLEDAAQKFANAALSR